MAKSTFAPKQVNAMAISLQNAFVRPITVPGSEQLAQLIFNYFSGYSVATFFAEIGLKTLQDGKSHDRIAISPYDPYAAIWFVAWNGSHQELWPERYGHYLESIIRPAKTLVQKGIQLVGFLVIDAYVRINDTSHKNEADCLNEVQYEVDVEYSYLPGYALESSCPGTARIAPHTVEPRFVYTCRASIVSKTN